ncbi:hypothetical protein BPUTSESOX_156, partial [uncultured Gammaproteobacteria bacterium]
DIEITPSVSFELGQENNNTMDATSYGKLTVKLPLGNKQKFTNFAIASKAFKDSRKMDLGALAWVERSNKIMIEGGDGNTISFKGLTYKLVTSPYTGRVWLDRNLGAKRVATSSDDTDAYGDYFPFYDPHGKDICPAGFSVPTEGELGADAIPTTRANTNIATAFSSFLKLPAAGEEDLLSTKGFRSRGSATILWTKTLEKGKGRYLSIGTVGTPRFLSGNTDSFGSPRLSVRCIQTQAVAFKGLTYRLIPSSLTNKVWLDRNLGAREVCDQEGSKNAACFGDYYQWGRATDGHENKNSSVITAVQLSSLTQDNGGKFIGEPKNNGTYNHDWTKGDFDEEGHLREAAWADGGVNDICPTGFSVPTKGEVEAEDLVGGKFAEFLKLPDNGLRTRFGGFYYEDYAVLWTRTPSWGADTKKFTDNRAWSIRGKQFKYLYWNGNGMGVRCIKD